MSDLDFGPINTGEWSPTWTPPLETMDVGPINTGEWSPTWSPDLSYLPSIMETAAGVGQGGADLRDSAPQRAFGNDTGSGGVRVSGPWAPVDQPVTNLPAQIGSMVDQGGQTGGVELSKLLDKKNMPLTLGALNILGALLKKKQGLQKAQLTNNFGRTNNFTPGQQKVVDAYLNDFSKKQYNPLVVNKAQGGLLRMAAGGAVPAVPPKPSAYQNKFYAGTDKWLNTNAGADRGRLTAAQRSATKQHLWDTANNTFKDIYGSSLDDFAGGKWKGDGAFANAETLAGMQQYVKDPSKLLANLGISGATVFDPTHNQWVQGGYQQKEINNPRYNPKVTGYGQMEQPRIMVNDPKTFKFNDVAEDQNLKYGEGINKGLFNAFYTPGIEQGTWDSDPYTTGAERHAGDRARQTKLLQDSYNSLYGSQDNALKYNSGLESLYSNPSAFDLSSVGFKGGDDLASAYATGRYGMNDKGLNDVYSGSINDYMQGQVNSDAYKKYLTDQITPYGSNTNLTVDQLQQDALARYNGGKSQNLLSGLTSQTPEQLTNQQRQDAQSAELATGTWGAAPDRYKNLYNNYGQGLADYGMNSKGEHPWYVRPEAVPGITVKKDGGLIHGYAQGGKVFPLVFGGDETPAPTQAPLDDGIERWSLAEIQSPDWMDEYGSMFDTQAGNPNAMPLIEGYHWAWQGPPGNPNSMRVMMPDQPEAQEAEGGGCFITTATTEASGQADDNAPELRAMRELRDVFLETDPRAADMVDEYYRIAPRVVAKLEAAPGGKDILRALHQQFILPAAEAVAKGDYESAFQIYTQMIEQVAPLAGEDEFAEHAGEASQMGGLGQMAHAGPGKVSGEGSGQSDHVPALLSDGEYVMDAESVSALGDGSTEAGAKLLDGMRENIRVHKRGGSVKAIPPKAKSIEQYLQGA